MQEGAGRKLPPARDQLFVQRIELVRFFRQLSAVDEIAQPAPLHDGALEKAGRRVRIVFEQLRRPRAVIDQIEAAIEAPIAALPALRDQIPGMAGNGELAQDRLVSNRMADEFVAQRAEFFGRRLEILLDLAQGEFVARTLVPIGLAVDHREIESDIRCAFFEIGPFLAGDAPHGYEPLECACPA